MAKKVVCFVLSLVVFLGIMVFPTPSMISYAYDIPEYIRVALKYENTALEYVYVMSDTGGTVGVVQEDNFTEIASFNKDDRVDVVFDSKYHLAIGDAFNTYDEIKAYIEVLKAHAGDELDIPIFPVYTGKWIACASLYTDTPIMEVSTADNGIDEFSILHEIFALPDLINTPEGKEEGPSYPVVPIATDRFAMRVEIDNVPLFAVSDPANLATVRVKPHDPGNPNIVPLLRLYEVSQPEALRFRSRYRGVFDLHRLTQRSKDNFVVVNKLKLEEYLYSVVPAEMSAGSDSQYDERIEALKVQAIAARTFAVKFIEGKNYQKYKADIENTTTTQVYGGYNRVNGNMGEYNNTTKAIDQTRGQVLIYNGKLAQNIYYHSNSGGYTEHPIYVWWRGGSYPPYVVSKPDPYTEQVPRIWTNSYTGKSISSTISSYIQSSFNVDVGQVKYINVVNRSTAGRVIDTLIEGSKSTYLVTNESNRWMLSLIGNMYTYHVDDRIRIIQQRDGEDKFLSERARKVLEGEYFTKEFVSDQYGIVAKNGHTYERIKVYDSDKQTIIVNGKGSGHGVGMSQHGVQQMSRLGFTYEEIIEFYFPGLQISERK